MRPNLENITICAADCVNAPLALRAIKQSMALCDFGDAILFTDKPPTASDPVRCVEIERLASKDDYSRFILQQLVDFTQTPFILIVQWDGYVLDPLAWNSSFTEFDLVGAKWHWHKDGMTVGNGGFTLRSRKLLEAIRDPRFPFIPNMAEDVLICRTYRSRLVNEFGIRFAPESLADEFSYERSLSNVPTFGFHGLFNMWRHLEDEQMIAISREFSPHIFRSIEFYELILQYFMLRKFRPLRSLYVRLKNHCRPDEIRSQMQRITNDANFTDFFMQLCEHRLMTESGFDS